MRKLGFVFVVLLLLGAVGVWRGWFTVRATHAGERGVAHVGVDQGKIDDDARAAIRGAGELSKDAVDKVKAIARGTSPDERVIEGSVTAVDVADRDLTVTSGDQKIDVYVPNSVAIRRDGRDVTFGQLAAGHRVSLTFHVDGETWRLQRIELLS